MITLSETEINDLNASYSSFEIDEQTEVQPDWVSRKFPSSGRVMRCVENDGVVIIKQMRDIEYVQPLHNFKIGD